MSIELELFLLPILFLLIGGYIAMMAIRFSKNNKEKKA